MPTAPSPRFGPYEILTRLGAGGMGEVFRARDTRLDRIVALKVLPADRAGDAEARSRFEREAKSIAALNHPNICAIHDVGLGDAEQPMYLVMELLEGHTLQERLLQGPLTIDQVIEYGVALADALDTAHARGVIHRDLKPANIFLTSRGIPKILDFGLAKTLADTNTDVTRKSDDLTELGTTVGTVAYMSPEQLRAEPLDSRSDLFSFGLVLYEMATGQRAFAGATSAVVSAGILAHEPAPPIAARPEIPDRLNETILKCLEKDRTLRCQSAAELRADLTRLKRQSGSQPARSAIGPASSAAATPASNWDMKPSPVRPASTAMPGMSTTGSSSAAAPVKGASNRSIWMGIAAVAVLAAAFGAYKIFSTAPPPPVAGPAPEGAAGPPPALPPAPAPANAAAPERATPPSPSAPATDPKAALAAQASAGTPAASPSPTPSPAPPTATVEPAPPPGPPPLGPRGGRPLGSGPGRRGMSGGPALVALLQKLPPVPFEIAFAAGDDRAREMAMQLRGALVAAGWRLESTSEVPAAPVPLVLFIPERTAGSDALINWARRNGYSPEVRPSPRSPRLRIVIGRQ